jgi:hypothetical protein
MVKLSLTDSTVSDTSPLVIGAQTLLSMPRSGISSLLVPFPSTLTASDFPSPNASVLPSSTTASILPSYVEDSTNLHRTILFVLKPTTLPLSISMTFSSHSLRTLSHTIAVSSTLLSSRTALFKPHIFVTEQSPSDSPALFSSTKVLMMAKLALIN